MPTFIRPKISRDPLKEATPIEPSTGDFAKLGFERGFTFSPTSSLARMTELTAAEFGESKILEPEEANKIYGIKGQLSFAEPVKAQVAKIKHERKVEEIERDKLLSRANGFVENGVAIGSDLMAAILDPINIAASFVPVVRGARAAKLYKRFSKFRARLNIGAAEGFAGATLVEPIILAGAVSEDSNYTAYDSFMNIAFGGPLGGGLHTIGGFIGDKFKSITRNAHEDAVRTAVAQAAEGKAVEVEPIIKNDVAESEPLNFGNVEFENIPDPLNIDRTSFDTAYSEYRNYTNKPSNIEGHEYIPMEALTQIGEQLGSTPGFKAVDIYGQDFYVKTNPDNPDHLKTEYLASLLYENLGVKVTKTHLTARNGKIIGIASEFVDDAKPVTPDELAQILKNPKAMEAFGAGLGIDIWLSNWDAFAPGNILIKDGIPIRTDFGGSMIYRSKGELKDETFFDSDITELSDFFSGKNKHFDKIADKFNWLPFYDENINAILADSLFRLKFISDEQIFRLVKSVGFDDDTSSKLIKSLIARRDSLISIREKLVNEYLTNKYYDPDVGLDWGMTKADAFSALDAQMQLDEIDEYSIRHGGGKDSLTPDERKAIDGYQGSDYAAINEYLRTGELALDSEDYTNYMREIIPHLDSATQKWTAPEAGVLWRRNVPVSSLGIPVTKLTSSTNFGNDIKGLIGKEFVDKGFMSTTHHPTFAKKAKYSQMHGDVVLKLHYSPGQKMALPNKVTGSEVFKSEYESILPRNTKFRIVEVYDNPQNNASPVVVAEIVGEKPIFSSPESAIKMAEKYANAHSSAADLEKLTTEQVYSLMDAFNLETTDDIIKQINTNLDELEQELQFEEFDQLEGYGTIKEDLEQINKEFSEAKKLADAQKKGALASYKCVIRNS